jgi:hypothetical protein
MKELFKTIQHETEKGILIGADDEQCWLPKSLIELDKLGDGTAVVVLPEWLASKTWADLSELANRGVTEFEREAKLPTLSVNRPTC